MITFRALNDGIPEEWKPGGHWQVEYYSDDFESAAPQGLAWVSAFPALTRLDFILVRDDQRRQGIGTALVAACRARWPGLRGLDEEDAVSDAGEAFARSLTAATPPSEATAVEPGPGRPADPRAGGTRA